MDNISQNDIVGTALPLYAQGMDHPSWVDSPNGMCSALAAYDFLNKNDMEREGVEVVMEDKDAPKI